VPELIIKNKYAKKKESYDLVISFLKQVRDSFLLNKQQKEIAKFIEEGMKKQYMDEEAIEKLKHAAHKQKDISKISITEDDQVDFKFLDDEVRALEDIQEKKMEVIERFERLCKRSLETKIQETIREAEKNAKSGGSSKISPAMHVKIEKAVFARVIDETIEQNHDHVFTLRFQIEKIDKLFATDIFPSKDFTHKLEQVLSVKNRSTKSEYSGKFFERLDEE
jgi:hypothetical protein